MNDEKDNNLDIQNSLPKDIETYEPEANTKNSNEESEKQFTERDITFSQKTDNINKSDNTKYTGPVIETNFDNKLNTSSYNSLNSTIPKSHAQQWKLRILIILLALIILAVVFGFLV